MDEQSVKQIIQEVLLELREDGCNTPIVNPNTTLLSLDGITERSVPGWSVVFSCNAADIDRRRLIKFEIETPDEKSESEIKQEILATLQRQLA